jgi:hypothetical protein
VRRPDKRLEAYFRARAERVIKRGRLFGYSALMPAVSRWVADFLIRAARVVDGGGDVAYPEPSPEPGLRL